VLSLLPLAPGSTKYFEHDNSENRIAYEYAWNILAGLDQNAILFTNGDNDTFPICTCRWSRNSVRTSRWSTCPW